MFTVSFEYLWCFCLVIGKGGEQIASIQSETECRIQFAPGLCSF